MICTKCPNQALAGHDTCYDCRATADFEAAKRVRPPTISFPLRENNPERERATDRSLASRYPQYYKQVGQLKEVDVYAVCLLFPVDDPSGCINHARKKLLIPGVRTGGKSMRKDVQEAIDTLNRWMQLNPEQAPKLQPLDLEPKV